MADDREGDCLNFQRALLVWYRRHKRDLPWRATKEPYRIWVSEVMLQQTQVNTVIPYYQRFIACFPDLSRLAEADSQSVLKLWEGLGYYSRARNFHRACRMVKDAYDGRIPQTPEEFIKLPGVGEYTAAAVLSIAFNAPLPVIDGNVKRVLARLYRIDHPVNRSDAHKVFKTYAEQCFDPLHPGEYNQALMELGAMVCKPGDPLCRICPVNHFCESSERGTVSGYPRRDKAPEVPIQTLVAGVVAKPNGALLIVQRPADGLLGGLWEFPTGPIAPGEKKEDACRRVIRETTGIEACVRSHLTRVRHAYTHFKIVMDVFLCDFQAGRVRLDGPVAHRWLLKSRLAELPIHKANHKFIHLFP